VCRMIFDYPKVCLWGCPATDILMVIYLPINYSKRGDLFQKRIEEKEFRGRARSYPPFSFIYFEVTLINGISGTG
jgi:hypothetical protein